MSFIECFQLLIRRQIVLILKAPSRKSVRYHIGQLIKLTISALSWLKYWRSVREARSGNINAVKPSILSGLNYPPQKMAADKASPPKTIALRPIDTPVLRRARRAAGMINAHPVQAVNKCHMCYYQIDAKSLSEIEREYYPGLCAANALLALITRVVLKLSFCITGPLLVDESSKVAYFIHDLSDPAVGRRIRMLRAGGASVQPIGFRRSSHCSGMVEDLRAINLGRTTDGMLARRAVSVSRALSTLHRHADQVRGADVVLARNLEMLLIASRARKLYAPAATLSTSAWTSTACSFEPHSWGGA